MYSPLRTSIQKFVALSDEEWNLLLPHLKIRKIKKHDLFSEIGSLAGEIGFVLQGSMRHYYIKDGEEKTTYFYFENHFVASYISCITWQPSLLAIQALSDCELIVFPYPVLQKLFETIGTFDALVATAGIAYFGPFEKMTEEDFRLGIDSKLMGQINLVLIGKNYINPKGSFTLTSGTLSDDPVRFASAISTVNGAINSFVKAAAVELDNGIRINAVAPGVVEDSPAFHPFFPGSIPVSMSRLSMAYVKSTLGAQSGQVYKAE